MSDPSGILVLDKPSGPTSHDITQRVRRVLGTRKVGHSGTLDPLATGILLLGVGRATRILHFLQPLSKIYRATIRFGITTSTQDSQGDVVIERPCSFDRSDLEREARAFVGEIEQKPPMVSAIKVGGEPLYRAARRGEEVERSSRTVRVYELSIEEFSAGQRTATILARVSGGTYVRTIAADLGERLGCGAHLTGLRRLAIGSFGENEAVPLDVLEAADRQDALARILPMSEAMRDFPSITLQGDEAVAVRHGRPLEGEFPARSREIPLVSHSAGGNVNPHQAGMTAGIPVAMLDEDGNLLAVYRRSRKGLKPAAVLVGTEAVQ